MAVENALSMELYASKVYQNKKDYNSSKKATSDKEKKSDKTEFDVDSKKQVDRNKSSESEENVPITFEQAKDRNTEYSTEEKIQEFIESQKFVHEKIRKSLDEYSSRMGNYEAKFGMHEATNRVMIKLVDKDTREVIKELPPEKTLDMIAKCLEQAGILVDEKV